MKMLNCKDDELVVSFSRVEFAAIMTCAIEIGRTYEDFGSDVLGFEEEELEKILDSLVDIADRSVDNATI